MVRESAYPNGSTTVALVPRLLPARRTAVHAALLVGCSPPRRRPRLLGAPPSFLPAALAVTPFSRPPPPSRPPPRPPRPPDGGNVLRA